MFNSKRLLPIAAISLLAGLGIVIVAGDLSAGSYVDSAHGGYNDPSGTTGVSRDTLTGYVAGNCAHCHEQHASIGGVQPGPNDGPDLPSKRLLFRDLTDGSGFNVNSFCLYCHGGPNTPNNEPDINTQFNKPSAGTQHDPLSLTSLALNNGAVTCLKCHNPHAAQPTSHTQATDGNDVTTAGPTVKSGPLQEVSGVQVTWPATGTPGVAGTENINPLTPTASYFTAVNAITKEYELCLKCHSAFETGLVPIGEQFNPGYLSVHPVATTLPWNNQFLLGNFATAFTVGSNFENNLNAKMYCSDCHASDGVSPAGPHGSNNPRLLKSYDLVNGNADPLCISCHNVPAVSNFADPAPVPMNGDHTLPQHQSTVTNILGTNPLGCLACHGGWNDAGRVSNIHGANYRWPDLGGGNLGRPSREFLVSPLITQNYYNPTDIKGNRWCASNAANCHTGGVAYNY